eukprot:UN22354
MSYFGVIFTILDTQMKEKYSLFKVIEGVVISSSLVATSPTPLISYILHSRDLDMCDVRETNHLLKSSQNNDPSIFQKRSF